MSSTIPKLTLFPLYPGGPQVSYNAGSLNANSSFYTQANQFTPGYAVNAAPTSQSNKNYSLNNNGGVSRSSNDSAFKGLIGFDAAVLGGIKKTAVPGVPPVIPNLYEAAAKLLSQSEANMTDLLNQPSFNINRLGITVKTDGAGGVDSVSINPALQKMNPGLSALDPSFVGLNRAQITTGAIFNRSLDSGLGGSIKRLPGANGVQNPLDAVNPNQILQPLKAQGLDPLSALLQQSPDLDAAELNPILARLNQLQPSSAGLPVTGFDAVLGVQESRQIAATQAKFDVVPSDRFRDNVANLASVANRQTDSYATSFKPTQMDGRIPMAPSLPHPSSGIGQSQTGLAQEGFNLTGGMANASDKKGSGGYVPFQMQSQTQSGFSGGSNPFMLAGGFENQSNQQQQQRRRLPAFVA